MIRAAATAGLLLLVHGSTGAAQGLPRGKPEQQGLSEARLERLGTTLREYANGGRIAGTVALIARNGTVVYLDSSGYADKERGAVMRPDAIFRIASMSKAITSVAIMMLVEEGRIGLNDPVSKFIPGFARTTVARDSTDALGKKLLVRVPAKRLARYMDRFLEQPREMLREELAGVRAELEALHAGLGGRRLRR